MGAWGMSPAGKEARGWPREAGAWNADQFKRWLAKSQGHSDVADWARDWGLDYWKGRADTGVPSPGQVRQTGQQILPGVDPANQRMMERWNQIYGHYQGMTPAGQTAGNVGQNLDDYRQWMNQHTENLRRMGDETYWDMAGREKGASADMLGDIGNLYGGLRDQSGRTFDQLIGSSGQAFDKSMQDLEMLRPGSEAAAAQAARAFQPMAAATQSRLRRAGVDPNSPEAAGLMGRVDVAKARAMDDRLASGTEGYVDRKTGLRLGKEGVARELGLGRLGADVSLATRAGDLTQGEKRRTLDAMQGLDSSMLARRTGVEESAFNRVKEWVGEKNNLELLKRELERGDLNTEAEILKGMNDQEITALKLLVDQYGLGMQHETADQQSRDAAAAKMLGITEMEYRNMFGSAQTAQGFSDRALDSYLKTLGIEGANAGWLKKLLGGMGMNALNVFAPGLGSILSGQQQQGGKGVTTDLSRYYDLWG